MLQTVVAAALLAVAAQASSTETRTAAPVPRVLGEVTAVDAAAHRVTLKTDAGEAVTVVADEKTSYLRAHPGARDLTGATPVTLGEIAVGDRVLARGPQGADRTLAARQIVVMARADIAQKNEEQAADWRRRGVSGVITAIDPASRQLTVEVRSLASSQTLTVDAGKTAFKRYAPESVRFSDARDSAFADLQVGDQVRVRGDRTADGAKITAEQVVSGSFQVVSGAVKSVDGGTLTLTNNENGQPIVVTVRPDAVVRRLPPEMALRLAMRNRGAGAAPAAGAGAGAGTGAGGGTVAHAGAASGWAGRRGGAPGGPPATLQDMLERLPALPVDQLEPGDQVAVSSTTSGDASRLTAVVVLAGIEPLLESRPRGGRAGGETLGLSAGALDMGLGIP